MFLKTLLPVVLATASLSADLPEEVPVSQIEREQLVNEIKFTIMKMYRSFDFAEAAADTIWYPRRRELVKSMIAGAVSGAVASKSGYGGIIGGLAAAVGELASTYYENWEHLQEHLDDADFYAWRADQLQERLWTE